MENIISVSKCFEKVEVGYVSTFVAIDRVTNEVISVSYNWYEYFDTSSTNNKSFDSFESLNTFINELLDAKNEAELNSLELQTYE